MTRGASRNQLPVSRGFELVVGQNLERQVEAPVQLVLPLLRQTAGTDHQAALQIAARDQFLDEQSRHDGLAGARVVGQQETKRLSRQHGFVHRGDLVRQWLDLRGVHGEHRVEEMREANALRLGDQAQQGAVAVETPRPPDLGHLEPLFVVTVQKLIGDLASGRLVGQLERLGAEPLHADNRHQAVGQNTAHRSVGLQVFKFHVALFFFSNFQQALEVGPKRA